MCSPHPLPLRTVPWECSHSPVFTESPSASPRRRRWQCPKGGPGTMVEGSGCPRGDKATQRNRAMPPRFVRTGDRTIERSASTDVTPPKRRGLFLRHLSPSPCTSRLYHECLSERVHGSRTISTISGLGTPRVHRTRQSVVCDPPSHQTHPLAYSRTPADSTMRSKRSVLRVKSPMASLPGPMTASST